MIPLPMSDRGAVSPLGEVIRFRRRSFDPAFLLETSKESGRSSCTSPGYFDHTDRKQSHGSTSGGMEGEETGPRQERSYGPPRKSSILPPASIAPPGRGSPWQEGRFRACGDPQVAVAANPSLLYAPSYGSPGTSLLYLRAWLSRACRRWPLNISHLRKGRTNRASYRVRHSEVRIRTGGES